jgi:hypothetical protein
MQKVIISLLVFISLVCCFCNNKKSIPAVSRKPDSFKLYYTYAGIGSNSYSAFPAFSVENGKYWYSLRQDGFITQKERKKPDTLFSGLFREGSRDSVINMVKGIKDTLVHRSNPGILSGGIDFINISNDSIKIAFELFNASDSSGEKIVNLLNSYIPAGYTKLSLFEQPVN